MAKKSDTTKRAVAAPVDQAENSWDALYIMAEHWQSDLQFFADEIRFLTSLVDKYFIWLTEEKNIERTRTLAADLTKLRNTRSTVQDRVSNHLKEITNLIKNPGSQDTIRCKDEHGELENSLTQLMKDFRKIKRDIFQLTEDVIESEKAQHFLNR